MAGLIAAVLGGTALPVAAADPVQRVEVRLVFVGAPPHALVTSRIVESITTAADRLLVGRDSELVTRQEPMLAGILREVLDRVLRGYRVDALSFQPGATTVVDVRLQPRPPVLEDLPVVVTIQGIHPDAQPLVRAAIDPIVPEVQRLPARLPADALEWASPILEQRMAELVERGVPGFTGVGKIEVAPARRVALTVSARDPRVIRDIGVRFRSSSIPSILLQSNAPQVTSMAEPLRGLPVVFAAAHRTELQALIARQLAAYPSARQYGIFARPSLQIAEVTFVTVLAESTIYRGRIEARLNFGTKAPPADVRAHLGRAFGSLEPFVEFTLIPSTLSWHTALGLQFDLGTNLAIGVKSRFDSDGAEPFAIYRLSPDLSVRGSYTTGTETFEGALSYRFNEFLSFEAVGTSRSVVWVRVISNL